jgi:hypothetical protein
VKSRSESLRAECSPTIASITLGLGEPTRPSSPPKKTLRLPYSSMPRHSWLNLVSISPLVAASTVASARSRGARRATSGPMAAASLTVSSSSRVAEPPSARIAASSSPPVTKDFPSIAAASSLLASSESSQLTAFHSDVTLTAPAERSEATAAGCGVVGLSATAEAEIRRTPWPMYAAGSSGRRRIQLSTARESWASSDATCAFSYAAAAACIAARC